MTLVNVIGDLGSGKTLFTTYLATLDDRPIYANYRIKVPNFHPLKPEILHKIEKPTLVILDEAYSWIESRTSGKDINRYMSYILFQSRKRGIDFLLTQQLIGTIDTRFRQMANFEVYCEPIQEGFLYRIFKRSNFGIYRPIIKVMTYDFAETLFPKYDTYQRIDPIDEELLARISKDKTDVVKEVDSIMNELLKHADADSITKGVVSDFCLRNEKPKSYVQLVYDALQSKKLGIESTHKYKMK